MMKDNYPCKKNIVPNELRRGVKIYLRETSLPHVRPGAINRGKDAAHWQLIQCSWVKVTTEFDPHRGIALAYMLATLSS